MVSRNLIFIVTGTLALVVALVLYITLGVTVIQTYNNESEYKKTTCTVRGVEIHRMNSKDDWYKCPWQCTVNHTPEGLKTQCEISEYPCLRIVVDVETKSGLRSAILHENPDKMFKSPDCSTYYCDRDSVVNEKDVNKFKRKYGSIAMKYSCYYNVDSLLSDDYDDDGQEHALLRLTYNKASYVNGILWPTLVAFAGLVLATWGLVGLFIQSRNKRAIKKRLPNNGL